MLELNAVNKLLGGHNITIEGIRKLLKPRLNRHVHICEVGCGGGDNLFAVYKWCQSMGITASFTGIDIKEHCIDFAKEQYPNLPSTWMINDYAKVNFETCPDLIFTSLFCHHFTDEQLIFMLKWMKENSKLGFFINDLHRHPVAYYSIRFLTQIFSGSYLVKNDAPLSVARSFRKHEWKILFKKAGIPDYTIQWKWAFRYLIICKK